MGPFGSGCAWPELGVLGAALMIAACSTAADDSTGPDDTSGSANQASNGSNGASTDGTGGTGGSRATSGSAGTGGEGGTAAACVIGDERCDCYPNDTCNGSLSCFSGLCVDAGTGGDSGGDSGGDGSGGGTTQGSGGDGSGGDTTTQSSGGGDTSTTTDGKPPDPGSCESPLAACGGDVAGTWTVAASCLEVTGEVDLSSTGLGCLANPIVTGSVETSGTVTFAADGTASDETRMTGEASFEMAADCLEISGTVTTCDRIGGPVASLGFASAECVANEAQGGCSCTASYDQDRGLSLPSTSLSTTATYLTAGNTLTVSYGSRDVEHDYCVDDDTLHLTPLSTSPAGTVVGEITLFR